MFKRLSTQHINEFHNAQQLLRQHREQVVQGDTYPNFNIYARALKFVAGHESDKFDINNQENHRKLAYGLLLQTDTIENWKTYDFVQEFDDEQFTTAIDLMAEQKNWHYSGAQSIGKSLFSEAMVEIVRTGGYKRSSDCSDLQVIESNQSSDFNKQDHSKNAVDSDSKAVQLEVIKSNLIKEISAKLKTTVDDLVNTPYKFNLKKAVEAGWIKITFDNYGEEVELVNQIFSSGINRENKSMLSLGLVLAHLLTGSKIEVKGKIDFIPGNVSARVISMKACGRSPFYGITLKNASALAKIDFGFTVLSNVKNHFLHINYNYSGPRWESQACSHIVDAAMYRYSEVIAQSLVDLKNGGYKTALKIGSHESQPLSTVNQDISTALDQTAAVYLETVIHKNTQRLLMDPDLIRDAAALLTQAIKTAETNPDYKNALSDFAGLQASNGDSNDCDSSEEYRDTKENKAYSFQSFFDNFLKLPGANAEELNSLSDNGKQLRLGNDFVTEFRFSNQQRPNSLFNQLPPHSNPESVLHLILQGDNVATNQDSQILLADYLLRHWSKIDLFSWVRKAWYGSLSNEESDRFSNVRALCHDLYRQIPGLAINPGQKRDYRTQLLQIRDQYKQFLADDYVTAAQLEKLEQEVNGLATQLQLEPKGVGIHHPAKMSSRHSGFFKPDSPASIQPFMNQSGASNFIPLLPQPELMSQAPATAYLR